MASSSALGHCQTDEVSESDTLFGNLFVQIEKPVDTLEQTIHESEPWINLFESDSSAEEGEKADDDDDDDDDDGDDGDVEDVSHFDTMFGNLFVQTEPSVNTLKEKPEESEHSFNLFESDSSEEEDEKDDDDDNDDGDDDVEDEWGVTEVRHFISNDTDKGDKSNSDTNKGGYSTFNTNCIESETRQLPCILDSDIPHRSQDQMAASNLSETKKGFYKPLVTQMSEEDFNHCVICMDSLTRPKVLDKCSHKFCIECIEEYFRHRPMCPVCFVPYGIITGTQPEGHMDHSLMNSSLPGYPGHKTIVVSYSFPSGIQGPEHPHPGVRYSGTSRTGFLPDNEEGRKVLALLKVAFKRRLVFTIGRSRTTGCDNTVTWNDIHHKTCTSGGQENFGYPDPTYLERVQQELAAFGVTEDSLKT